MPPTPFTLTPKITLFPIIHGSGDCALAVRRMMLSHQFDALAVPLPPSFQADVETAIERLPTPGIVIQAEPPSFSPVEWTPESEREEFDDDDDDRDDPLSRYR